MSPVESWSWAQEQQISAQEKLQQLKDAEKWLDDQALSLLDDLIKNLDWVDLKLKDVSWDMTEVQKNDLLNLYNWFQQEIISYSNDLFLDDIEKGRMEAINNQLNILLSEDDPGKLWITEWLESFDNIEDLVESREMLKWIDWAWDLYALLNMIDTIWTENLDQDTLDEYVSGIFWDKKLDSSDVANLQSLNEALRDVYNISTLNSKQEVDNSLENKSDRVETAKDIINLVEWAKWIIPDWLNERAPSFQAFFDNISSEIREAVTDDSTVVINNLWWSLTLFIEWIKNLWNGEWSAITNFLSSGFNLMNWIRHLIPKALQTLCAWIKEIKNYYIGISWSKEKQWVVVKLLDETTENMDWKWYCPDGVADAVNWTAKLALAITNGVTDAMLDFLWWAVDVVLTPEVALWNFKDMVWDISMDWISKMLGAETSTPLITQYVSYIWTMISLSMSTWISMINKIQDVAGKLAQVFWKPMEIVWELIQTITWGVKKIAWWLEVPIWSVVAKLDDMTPRIEIRETVKEMLKKAWQQVVDLDDKFKFVEIRDLLEKAKNGDVLWVVDTLNNTTTRFWGATAHAW